MEPITEEQEIRIDKSAKYYGAIRFERKDGVVVIAKNIYLYGEVNFDNDDDLDLIEKFNLINEEGNWIYSNFDYENGNFTTVDGRIKSAPTWDLINWFKYCHVLIGNPQRNIVYKRK